MTLTVLTLTRDSVFFFPRFSGSMNHIRSGKNTGKLLFSPIFATVSNFRFHYHDHVLVKFLIYSGYSSAKDVKYLHFEDIM